MLNEFANFEKIHYSIFKYLNDKATFQIKLANEIELPAH